MSKWVLPLIMGLYLACSLWGLEWGLYSNRRSQYLFPDGTRWTPGKVAKFQRPQPPEQPPLGADVDPNPAARGSGVVVLNDDDEGIAEVYARYLLYSHQPDEMISFRALGEMDPGQWDFDPKLYQYGGMFIYPLGGLIKLASLAGWVKVGGVQDVLQDPHNFARCYVVGRLYVVLWGLLGVWIVHALGRRLANDFGGTLAAVCFCLMPVVVSLSHECKPHLPGAVLMLGAVLWAMHYVNSGLVKYRLLLAISCGLATSMVVSSAWIFVLIPLAELLTKSRFTDRLGRSVVFVLIGVGAYVFTNPYVIWNLITNRELLLSNLGNSVAMYSTSLEGLRDAWLLLTAGSSTLVVIGGVVMWVALWGWDWRRTVLLALPAAVVAAQFVLLAEGKPGEYARFGLFPNAALGIMLGAGLARFLVQKHFQAVLYSAGLTIAVAVPAWPYLENLRLDATALNSRYQLAARLQADEVTSEPSAERATPTIAVLREPAPYGFPPLDFGASRVVLLPEDIAGWPQDRSGWPTRLIVPLNGVEGVRIRTILNDGYYTLDTAPHNVLPHDRTPITWANRPLVLLVHRAAVADSPAREEPSPPPDPPAPQSPAGPSADAGG